MAAIKIMDTKAVDAVLGEATLALELLAKKYGLDLQSTWVSPDGAGSLTCTWTFSCMLEDGVPSSFAQYCPRFGLSPSDYGREVVPSNGVLYTLVGLKPKNRKYPIILKRCSDGKTYKFTKRVLKI